MDNDAITLRRHGDDLVIALAGRWVIDKANDLDRALETLSTDQAKAISVDLGQVESLDTAGAWLVYRTVKRLRGEGHDVALVNRRPDLAVLLDLVEANDHPVECHPPHEAEWHAVIGHVGRASVDYVAEARRLVAFLGLTTATLARSLCQPWRIRRTALVSHMEQTGLDAMPIVALISFLVGAVLAYQGAEQLRRFGAEIFVINLIGISVLREIAILLTAIIVAGRSGSAFTASIGSMKVREEIDAMRTLGLDPMELLVMPRLMALMITLPMLTFLADMAGLAGGMVMAWVALDISPAQFLERLGDAVPLWSFWVGIIKAPVFAFLIAMVGCYEGFQVEGSAESVGKLTTLAVVVAIFLVIVVDAIFSILFAYIGV